MKYVLILWTLGGPQVEAVLSSLHACDLLVESKVVEEVSAIRFCAEMDLDTVLFDVVEWAPGIDKHTRIKHVK